MKIVIALYIIGFALISCGQKVTQELTTEIEKSKKAKNIILMIGDGMGISQVSSAIYFKEGKSNFDRFPFVGLSKTSSGKQKITDSAAGATALSAGEKTFNKAIGVDIDSNEVELITEIAVEQGKKIGLVATSSIVHATPASFFAKHPNRRAYDSLMAQVPESFVDFFAGGGLEFCVNREDGRNIIEEAKEAGYAVDTTGLNPIESEKLLYLLAKDGMPRMLDGRGEFLENASIMGIKHLNNENGFFMMIEGSQIDWGGHDNDAEYLQTELIDFDNTIGKVLDWAEKDGETLVIVTADHETGGYALSSDPNEEYDYNTMKPTFSTPKHTGTMVGVFAFGPGAEKFTGVYENTEIFHKMKEHLK